MTANLLNYVLYQAGWCAAVLGAAWGYPWEGTALAAALLATHLALVRHPRAEWRLALAAGAAGLAADSTLIAAGLLHFPAGTLVTGLSPPWMVLLWMQFATTFRFSLRWLVERPVVAALAAAGGGPLAYAIGARLGAVALAHPRPLTLAAVAIVWLVAVPALARLAAGTAAGGYRFGVPPSRDDGRST